MAFKIVVFAAFMQDFISSVIDTSLTPRMPTSPGVRRYVNVDEAFKAGIEVSWTQSLFWGLQHQLGLAYTYAQDLQRDQPLPEIAPLDLRYSLSGTYVKGRLTPGISLRHVVQQDRVSPEFGESVTPAFTLLDIRAGYAVTSSIQLALGVTNLFDVRYYEHLNRPINMNGMKTPLYAPGRNAYATFSVAF
jgi:iron complex outermembrane receptor protein